MEDLPERKKGGDYVFEITRGLSSLVPMVGGPLQVLFENVFTPPLERRREEWLKRLGEVVVTLQERVDGMTVEALSNDERFISVAMHASQIAMRTHQDRKLEALRNAVLNAALPNAPEEDRQMIFLQAIDRMTPSHLRVLSILDDPDGAARHGGMHEFPSGMGHISSIIEHCIPELRGKRDLYSQAVRDLQAFGFLEQGQHLGLTMDGLGNNQQRTSAFGREFLRFITDAT